MTTEKRGMCFAASAFVPLMIASVSPVFADNCTGYDVLVAQTVETTDLGKGHPLAASGKEATASQGARKRAFSFVCPAPRFLMLTHPGFRFS